MKLLSSNIIGNGSKDLIILHGFLGMGDNWKSFAKKITNIGYKVHLLDQRNHGRSFWDKEFNYKILSIDLYNYVSYKNINNPIILGHSMGGKTAMKFAFDFPEKIKKLIVVDIVPKKYKESHIDILKNLYWISKEKLALRINIDILKNKVSEVSNFDYLTKNYKGHSFFLFGENSEYYDKNDDNIIKKFFPNSKISLIRNASHWLHVENPKDFFNEIKSWI